MILNIYGSISWNILASDYCRVFAQARLSINHATILIRLADQPERFPCTMLIAKFVDYCKDFWYSYSNKVIEPQQPYATAILLNNLCIDKTPHIQYYCRYTTALVNILVFIALLSGGGLVAAVLLCMKREDRPQNSNSVEILDTHKFAVSLSL